MVKIPIIIYGVEMVFCLPLEERKILQLDMDNLQVEPYLKYRTITIMNFLISATVMLGLFIVKIWMLLLIVRNLHLSQRTILI
jgi:hypothetical protein